MRILVPKQRQRSSTPASTLARTTSTSGAMDQSGSVASPSHSGAALFASYDFSAIPVHGSPQLPIQTKLRINEPGDAFEQEADRVSRHVMRLPEAQLQEPRVQRKCACGGTCAACRADAMPLVDAALQSPSRALDDTTMASRFGHDFSHVRVHTDPVAAQSASALNARAYTVANHVVFGAGEWAPGTHAGGALLAHELVHVLQQQRSVPAVQRQPKTAALSKDQDDFIRETVRFLEHSADYYHAVAKVDAAVFDRVINSWYSMVVRQEQLIDTDPHPNAALKASLRAAYISALRILVSKHAATSGQSEEDLYRINSGRIPMWALPHPSHTVAGMTTPIPDDVTVKTRRGRVQFNLNGFDVTVSPDIRVRSQRTPGLTSYHIGWGGVSGRFRRTGAGTTVVRLSGPATPVVTLLTSFTRGANTANTSGYGRGTTKEDQAGAKVTPASGSVAFHESRHSQVVLDFLRSNPPPKFGGKVGDTVAQFNTAMTQWQAAVVAYAARLEKVDTAQVHCVGFTVDEFNAEHPQRGRRIAKECP
jgi:hypothetical protein